MIIPTEVFRNQTVFKDLNSLIKPYIPGQRITLQVLDLLNFPIQYSPPFFGAGLLQYLNWLCRPPPHGFEHSSQAFHWLNPPWTILCENKIKRMKVFHGYG